MQKENSLSHLEEGFEMKLVLLIIATLLAGPALAQQELPEDVEEYAPLHSITKWKRGGSSFWWKLVLVQDDEDTALAEVRLKTGLKIEYRVEYPCRSEDGNILTHTRQTVVWERGKETDGVFTDCGMAPVEQEVPLIATELLGAPPEFYIWGLLKLDGF